MKQIWISPLLFCLLVVSGRAGPVDGPFNRTGERLRPAGEDGDTLETSVRFVGGKQAAVFARGDHDPVVGLELSIYGPSGQLVTRDESNRDLVAVFWVPARTAEYRIVLRNRGARDAYEKFTEPKKYTEVYLSMK